MRWSKFVILVIATMLLCSCAGSSKENVYPFPQATKIEVISYREEWEGADYSKYIKW